MGTVLFISNKLGFIYTLYVCNYNKCKLFKLFPSVLIEASGNFSTNYNLIMFILFQPYLLWIFQNSISISILIYN